MNISLTFNINNIETSLLIRISVWDFLSVFNFCITFRFPIFLIKFVFPISFHLSSHLQIAYLFPHFLLTTDFLSLSTCLIDFWFPISIHLFYQLHISYLSPPFLSSSYFLHLSWHLQISYGIIHKWHHWKSLYENE